MARQSGPKERGPAAGLLLLVLAAAAMLAGLWLWTGREVPVASVGPASATPAPLTPDPTPTPAPTPSPTPTPARGPGQAVTDDVAAQLDAFLDAQAPTVSVWLEDIESGDVYTYGPSAGFYCASTLKAPYALWLSLRDETGEIDLDESWDGATGWERIHEMISVSSNGAAHTLAGRWPATAESGFGQYLTDLGFASPSGCQITMEDGIQGWVTAKDGGLVMDALYRYFETGSDNALRLRQAFLDAEHEYLYFPAPAAKKYGSWDNAFHDMGVCYSAQPYILSVFTSYGTQDAPPPEGIEMMRQFGQLVAHVLGQDEG